MGKAWRPAIRTVVVIGGVVLLASLAGCTSKSSSGAPPSTTVTGTSTVTLTTTPSPTSEPTTSKASTVTSTVTRTNGGETITVNATKPPAATKEPAAVDGDCPYLSADVVSDITGQHHGQTQLITLRPHPVCVFYRSDGGLMGSVRVITAANAAAAIAAVNQHVPIAGSQPASQPAGWSGGSVTSAGQMTQDSVAKSVYAVSKGNIAIVAEENESPSIKARTMAVCAIYGLGLEKGATPDFCSVS